MTDIDAQVCETIGAVVRDWCREAADHLIASVKTETETREILARHMAGAEFKAWLARSQATLRAMLEDDRPHTIH